MFTVTTIAITPNSDRLDVTMRGEVEFAPGRVSTVERTFTVSQREYLDGKADWTEEMVRAAIAAVTASKVIP